MTNELDPYPWEIDALTAKQAIRDGRAWVLAAYLHDAAKGASIIADLADPRGDASPKLKLHSIRGAGGERDDSVEEEFVGTSNQLEQAVQRGATRIVGWYLRELSEVLRLTADTLSDAGNSEWKLRFERRRPGRPLDPAKRDTEREIEMKLRFGKANGIKQESTVAELMEEYGLSRATIMRIAMRINRPLKLKSHKKR